MDDDEQPGSRGSRPLTGAEGTARTPWWLWLSVPIALLGISGSVAGIVVDRIYANETASWESEAIGQDVANLVVIPVMLVLAYAARRGSAKALVAWAGTVVYMAYVYAIYAFAVHFGPLFLLYVAVFGLAVWALIGFFAGIDAGRVRAAYPAGHATRFVSVLLIVIAGGFALLWLSQDLPAMVRGTSPEGLRETGLLTNPVHVLDLALFLPAGMLAGVQLLRGRAWGHVLAPLMLIATAGISVGIVALGVVGAARGEDGSPAVAAVIGVIGLLLAIACWRFVRAMAPATRAEDLLRVGSPTRSGASGRAGRSGWSR